MMFGYFEQTNLFDYSEQTMMFGYLKHIMAQRMQLKQMTPK
jgi:hypothetical protein